MCFKEVTVWLSNDSVSKWEEMQIQEMGKYWNRFISLKMTIKDIWKIENICIKNTIKAWVKNLKSNNFKNNIIDIYIINSISERY